MTALLDYKKICEEIFNEVVRAKGMFPTDFCNQHEGYAVILEELDELWDEVKKNQRNYDLINQRKEAIQCAAMCVRFAAELLNKNK
jgi:NTP pyrophosphatase (non-canonical NTP hydrolase)